MIIRFQKSTLLKSLLGVVVFGMVLIAWRQYVLWRLPFDDVRIPMMEMEEMLEIPQRPGVQGIVISGPTIEPLVFAIDLTKAGVRTLDWRQLQVVDPHTDVKISCEIDNQGRLFFSQKDVLMGGHTEAGMMIQRVLKTWIYTPFKSGTIRFWFNLPSKGKKLLIDTSDLNRRTDIPGHIPIYDGRMHLIEGIQTSDIQVVGSF